MTSAGLSFDQMPLQSTTSNELEIHHYQREISSNSFIFMEADSPDSFQNQMVYSLPPSPSSSESYQEQDEINII